MVMNYDELLSGCVEQVSLVPPVKVVDLTGRTFRLKLNNRFGHSRFDRRPSSFRLLVRFQNNVGYAVCATKGPIWSMPFTVMAYLFCKYEDASVLFRNTTAKRIVRVHGHGITIGPAWNDFPLATRSSDCNLIKRLTDWSNNYDCLALRFQGVAHDRFKEIVELNINGRGERQW
jgi:hypothetical protein